MKPSLFHAPIKQPRKPSLRLAGIGFIHRGALPRRFLLLFACSFAVIGHAQDPGGPGKSEAAKARVATREAVRAAEFEAAIAAAASGDLRGAEALLAGDPNQRPSTVASELEGASRLGQVAVSLRQRGHDGAAHAVAVLALNKLEGIRPPLLAASAPTVRAQVWQAIGLVQERMLFDPAAARAAYSQAQRDYPEAPGAKAGLKRLNDEETKRARFSPKG